MADQIFAVNSGFFDAVNQDRLYSANDMNRPYKRLVANGVFATPAGTPSTDLQVVSAGTGMTIIVKQGEGIFANKWFENPNDLSIVVPNNTALLPRVDSVIVQIDTRTSGRVGNIVYRTGTPASSPSAPAINQTTGVTEYRIANVYVAASANYINNDALTDLRGSSSCPWVTALIQQVDTSTLYNQWQAAYQAFYDQSTTDYQTYLDEQKEAWEQWFDNLTEDLTVATNIVTLVNSYTVEGNDQTSIPIGIPSYNYQTDVLEVYINGLFADGETEWSLGSDHSSIVLNDGLPVGDIVTFYVLKSVIAADIQSTVTMIEKLDNKVSNFMSDSGWINFTLESGATAYDNNTKPAVRCVGNRVYLRGAFKGITSAGTTICTLPVSFRPAMDHMFISAVVSSTTAQDYVLIRISASTGTVKLAAISGTISSSSMIPLATSFLSATEVAVSNVYEYMGSVSTYADLPTSGMNAGDVYAVETADPTEGLAAGDEVVWNGTEWEPFSTVVTSGDIDEIINSLS